MYREELEDIFFSCGQHPRFNAAVAVYHTRDSLVLAAQNDAAAFLMKHPNVWQGHEPLSLTERLAQDFVDRGEALIRRNKQASAVDANSSYRPISIASGHTI